MSDHPLTARAASASPPTKHQLALMIWLAVFPTLTVLNLVLGDWLKPLSAVLRTFVLATVAVPIAPSAPPLFSMMTVWPRIDPMRCASTRAIKSVDPPALKATTMVIGRDG